MPLLWNPGSLLRGASSLRCEEDLQDFPPPLPPKLPFLRSATVLPTGSSSLSASSSGNSVCIDVRPLKKLEIFLHAIVARLEFWKVVFLVIRLYLNHQGNCS